LSSLDIFDIHKIADIAENASKNRVKIVEIASDYQARDRAVIKIVS
jgi:hypothetical protein